jgi:hypothetical protein
MRDSISLIANSGLQFYHFDVKLNNDLQKEAKFRFVEKFDATRRRIWLDEVVCVSRDEDLWARKSELLKYGYITKSGKLSEDLELKNLQLIDSTEFYEIGNLNKVLNVFEKKWIPLPYFNFNKIANDKFGPTDWVRLYFERINEQELKCVLLVDTTVSMDANERSTPTLHENANENIFSLCENDELSISFLDKTFDCDWVENYISSFFHKPNTELEKPYLKHAASFVFFIRSIRQLSSFPQINLLRNDVGIIDVDLVIDIGNSKTCAILFENPTGQQFHFNSVKKLEIIDLSNPLIKYDDSFSTRLVFKSSNFVTGNQEINQLNKFIWPSPVRIGYEAENTINSSDVEMKLSRETRTMNSSPKRYLWDDKLADLEWEFHLDDPELPFQRVSKKGVTEQLNSDGTFCKDGIFGIEARYSRKSLMTFVYLEIFSHAFRQINSIEFRALHGNPSYRRKIRRVVVSCPTAMIKAEQIALRQCAEDAIKIINNLKSYSSYSYESGKDIYDTEVNVIPSVKELSLTDDNLDQRNEWIYDEASAAQMVYLYGMIVDKFNGNAQKFFDVFKKPLSSEKEGKRELRVASFDVGGGTSDLMITDYELKKSQYVELKPNPLYWESFKVAGDDLLEQIIQQVIIEGEPKNENQIGCCGVIEQELRKLGKPNVSGILNGFFGQDSNRIGYRGRLMRTNFVNQCALPIANEFMTRAKDFSEDILSYSDIFSKNPPSEDLLNYFESHFGFRFESLKWKISYKRLKELCDLVYNRLFKQIGLILKAYDCDVLILSGRPFSLKAMNELMRKSNHLPSNRQINLNTFWIGRWYPFADDNGFVDDPKTIVCVGSLISLMGGSLLKLGDFRLDTSVLKRSLNSSANFIGKIVNNTIEDNILVPNKSEAKFQVTSLPFQIGYKKINSKKYPASVLYSLQVNEERVTEISKKKKGDDFDKVVDSTEDLKYRIRSKMPLSVSITRVYEEDKEKIIIEEVLDNEGNDISKLYFELSPQTMTDPTGFWLDTGEFKLGRRV